ncbi:GEVED domain-containing protein [Isoptericola jiangsuensis]|uniref:DUF7927 domain-containing protein n=1 Tax=Isoptericola jiangsuensis TaxID=548579 RepID=UPI001145C86A|nr:GEVED domain-containing protein [Isoptericola jiangsuensis]
MTAGSFLLAVGLTALPVVSDTLAEEALSPAAAVPGQPGVMEAPAEFFFEDFENVTWQEPDEPGGGSNEAAWDADDFVQTLTDYPFAATGAEPGFQPGYVNTSGTAYTADEVWAAGYNCNGLVMAAHGPVNYSNGQNDVPLPSTPVVADCNGAPQNGAGRWFNSNRLSAAAMGNYIVGGTNVPYPYTGQIPVPADPADNHVVTSFTQNAQAQAPGTMLEFTEPLPVDPGRYYQFSVDIVTQSCVTSGNGANPQFYITQSDGSESTAFSTPPDTCSGTNAVAFVQQGPGGGQNVSALGRQRTTRTGTWLGDTALRSTGDSIGLRIDNEDGAVAGNDTAFDNIIILDTTPKIDKQFSAYPGPGSGGSYPTGDEGTLTFTITNTHAPGEPDVPSGPKEDFGFTDTINDPALELTGTSETTCGDGTVTVDAGAGTVTLDGGDLVDPNLVTCTVTVGVTSDAAGTYTNGPDDMELVGLNPPGSTEISFADTDPVPCSVSAQLWQASEDSPPTTVFDVNLIDGSFVDQGEVPEASINGVGYSAIDGWFWGARSNTESTTPPEIVATSPDYTGQVLYGTPNFDDVPFGTGPFSTGLNIGDVSPDGIWYASTPENTGAAWLSVDVDPSSPTFMRVLDGDTSYGTGASQLQPGDDWSYYDGKLWSIGFNANNNTTILFSLDPSVDNSSLVNENNYGVISGPDGVNPSGPASSNRAWGATYTDDAGFLYASNNGTGQIWRFNMDAPTEPAAFFSYGPASGGNDGSRCPGPLPIDFGDAPDSYQTLLVSNGPFHGVTVDPENPLLTIGDTVTIEPDGQPDASAGLDEDDAFTEDPTVSIDAAETSLSIPITNDSDETAALVGWIDFDLSGTFEEDERSEVDTGTGSGNDLLTWTVPADAVGGDSYLRLRAGLVPPGELPTDPSEVGPGIDSGEVEDWPITLVELPVDYGDAPDSYGTLAASGGASHAVVDYDETTNTAPLMLGDENTVDTEADGVPTPGADGDDLAGVDDESSITEPVTAELGEDVTLDVLATNDTETDATLVAWMDGDQNGTFDPGEASTAVTVPAGSGSATYPVSLPAASVVGDSYLRVRLFDGANDDPQPTGSWTGGEVEDYVVTVVEPELTVTKSSDAGETVSPGDVVTYTVTVENTGTVDYTQPDNPASFEDDLSDVLDDATYNGDAVATPDQGDVVFVDPVLGWEGPLAVGESVTITYSVTVDDPPGGDGILSNTVVAPDSTCDPDVDPADPDCTVTTPVRSLEIEKTSEPVTTLAPGQTIEYSFTVTNTGGYDYTVDDPATADDDLSAVLDDAVYNGDAVVVPDQGSLSYTEPVLSWSGPLAAGESVTITYSVTVNDPLTGDGELLNVVEGPPESNCDPDADPADPDCTVVLPAPGLDVVKTAEPSSDPLLPGGTVTYTVELTNTGSTDYTDAAPAAVVDDLTDVLDDATYNGDLAALDGGGTPVGTTVDGTLPEIGWFGPIPAGETVTITYSVTVNDPATGDGLLTNAVVGPPESNCPPDSEDPDCTTTTPVRTLEIAKTSDAPAEVLPGDTVTYTVEVTNPSTVDYTVDDPASFEDDLADVVDDATLDEGSFTATSDAGGTPPLPTYAPTTLSWSGPLAAGETVTISYTVTVNDPATGDGVLTNAVTGPPESNCDVDADPADPDCSTTTPVRSVEIVKTSDAPAEVAPGDTVTYTVEVTNTGGVDYADPDTLLTVSDDLSEVLDDATYNGDATAVPDQGAFSFTDPTLSWEGPLAVGETVTITYSVTVDDPVTGDGVLTNTIVGPPESSCDPDQVPEDPDCSTTTPVRSVEIVKTAEPAGEVAPGDTVTYTVEVTNTGGVDYADPDSLLTVSDDLSEVLDDATYNGDATAVPDQGAFSFADPTLSWEGPLAVDETVTLTYSVTVDDPLDGGDGVLTNAVTGPPESTCVEGTEEGCTVTTPVASLDVVKTSDSPDGVVAGDQITYTVEVTNTGGFAYTDADPATVSDDLSAVLDDATWDDAVTIEPDQGTAEFVDPTLTWTGPLDVGETVTITYTLTVNDPVTGDGVLTNAVVGGDCPDPAVTDPDDPAFDPDCSTEVPVLEPGLDVTKTSDAGGEVLAGDTVVYTVTVENTGEVDYTLLNPAEVSDDLSDVLDDATLDDDSIVVTPDVGTVDFTDPTLSWSGPLAVGATVTITYAVTVDDPLADGDGVLDNTVVGPPESTCPEGSEDPDCTVTEPIKALEIVKTSDAAEDVAPGDTITYSVEITNTGQVDYTVPDDPASFTDDLTEVLDDATFDDGSIVVTPDQGSASFADPELTWTGPLAVGETVTVTYSVTLDDPPTGDSIVTNAVVGPPESNCDPDQVPEDPNCSTTTPTPAVEVVKTSDAAGEVVPGDTVTYTVEVTNTGAVAYTDDDPLTVTDDLTGVLDDATYNDDATATPDSGAFAFADPNLTWTGPLDVGATVTLTYSVTVDDPPGLLADGVLTNAVSAPGSNCVPGTEDPDCTVTTPVRSVEIVKASDAPAEVLPGDAVTYTVEVTNTGGVDYADPDSLLTVSDDLSEVLDDATYNDDATVEPDQGAVSFTDPILTWTGPLAAGESVTITYSVTVNDPLPEDGDGVLTNTVTGPPESTCADDADPADPDCSTTTPVRSVEIVKTSDAPAEVLPGATVTYTVEVTNTGGVDYADPDTLLTVSDDLSEVLDDATYNGDATAVPDQGAFSFADPTLSWEGPLAVDETVTLTYSVTVDDPLDGGDGVLTNAVTGPPESTCVDPEDPGCTTTTPVRSLEVVKSSDAVDEVLPGDTVEYTIEVTNTGGADYTLLDPAVVFDDLTDVLDDATFVDGSLVTDPTPPDAVFDGDSISWSGPLAAGETVTITYAVTVDDPPTGDGVLDNTVVGPPESGCDPAQDPADPDCTVTLPVRALEIAKTSDGAGEVLPGETVTYTVVVTNTGGADYTAQEPAVVADDLAEVLDDATYNDDATVVPEQGTVEFTDPTLTWTGPLAAGETVTITYSVTVGDPLPEDGDGVLTNAVTGPPESNCVDPEDPGCSVTDPVRQLDIVKEKVSPEEVLIQPGEVVTYSVTVTNTGGFAYTDADPASWDDDLSQVLDDATYNGDATAAPDQGTVSFTDPTLSWSGPLAVGETVTVTYSVTVNDPLSGDGILGNVVTGPPESTCVDPLAPGCFVVLPERQLDITKTADPDEPVVAGETVTYTVTVTNLSQVPYTEEFPASVVDDLTEVLDDATYNDDAAVNPDQGELTYAEPRLVWVGPLAGGESVEITYSVTVDDPLTGDGELANVVFEPPAPPPCENGVCGPTLPPTPECEDGVDPATGLPCVGTVTPVKELEVAKEVVDTSSGEDWVGPTQDVTYAVTVTNTGGLDYTVDDPAVVTDDLSDVLDDATLDEGSISVEPDQGTVTFDAPDLTWSGPLAVDESVTITYTVTVNDTVTGDGDLVNVVTGPPESNCVDGTEEGCTTTTPIRALEIVKTSDGGEGVTPGQVVGYTVEVTNTGTFAYSDADPAEVTDDLSAVLDDATFNDDAAVDPDVGELAYAEPELSWSGPLDPGETVTITYSVTVDDPDTGDMVLENVVTGPPESTCATDPSMSPGGASAGTAITLPMLLAVDNPDCSTEVPVLDRALEIDKSATGTQGAQVGDVVQYTVEVTNTGQGDYTAESPATVVDDLTGVLDDATYNDDAAVDPDTGDLAYAAPRLFWSGPLAAGDTVTITYSVTLTGDGDGEVLNVAFQPAGPGCTTLPDCGDITTPPPGECTDGADENGLPCDEVSFQITPPVTPAPPAPPAPGPGLLPRTGAGWVGLTSIALLLIVGGSLLYGVRRRQQHG